MSDDASLDDAGALDGTESMLVLVEAAPASDSWGFVGVVSVGDFEAYRTIRSYPAPEDALTVTQRLLAGVLGALMAGQEWRTASDEFGHAARRTELGYGLKAARNRDQPRATESPGKR